MTRVASVILSLLFLLTIVVAIPASAQTSGENPRTPLSLEPDPGWDDLRTMQGTGTYGDPANAKCTRTKCFECLYFETPRAQMCSSGVGEGACSCTEGPCAVKGSCRIG